MAQTSSAVSVPSKTQEWPRLPVEIVDHIIEDAWDSDMPPEERTHLFTSLCSVNHTFLATFIPIALKAVHIPSPALSQHYFKLLRDRTPHEPDNDYFLPSVSQLARLCHTVDIDVAPASWQRSLTVHSPQDPSAMAVSTTLFTLDIFTHLSALRTLGVHYTDWAFDDLFAQRRLHPVPRSVSALVVRYTYSSALLAKCARRFRREYARKRGPESEGCGEGWTVPGVTRLRVEGAPAGLVADLLDMCPNVERLELEMEPEQLGALGELPCSVRTIELRVLGVKADTDWGLEEALEGGLLNRCEQGLDVIVRGQEKDLAVWKNARSVCEQYGVRLKLSVE